MTTIPLQNRLAATPAVALNPVLTPVLSAKYALRWQHFALCCVYAIGFLLVSYIPLFHAITWRHSLVGEWILRHGELPAVEPGLPLAEGMPWRAASWLGDVVIALAYRWGGSEGVSRLLAVVVLAMLLIWGRVAYVLTGYKRFVAATVGALLVGQLQRLSILRPELMALSFLGGLVWLLLSRERRGETRPALVDGLGVAGLLAVWSNLDGSAIVGVAVLGCWAVGEWLDAAIAGGLRWSWQSPEVRRTLAVAECGMVGTLLQPLGWNLWGDWMLGWSSVTCQELGGFRPLVLASGLGLVVAGTWVAVSLFARFSRRRPRSREAGLLVLGTLLVGWNVDWVCWFIPLALVALLPHLADCLDRAHLLGARTAPREFAAGEPVPLGTFAWTLLSLLAIWTVFALTPISSPILGGKSRKATQIHSDRTPLMLGKFLQGRPSRGLIWAPEDWGDWILWIEPRARVVANSSVNRLPRQVRGDLLHVYRGDGNWTRTLDRYGVEYLILDKSRHEPLFQSALSQGNEWTVVWERDQAVVLRRKEII